MLAPTDGDLCSLSRSLNSGSRVAPSGTGLGPGGDRRAIECMATL